MVPSCDEGIAEAARVYDGVVVSGKYGALVRS